MKMPRRANLPEHIHAQLIDEVRARPSLYDKANKYYQSNTYNNRMWEEIGEMLGISGK